MKTQADLQSLLRALGTVSFSWRTFELTPDDPPNAPREASKREINGAVQGNSDGREEGEAARPLASADAPVIVATIAPPHCPRVGQGDSELTSDDQEALAGGGLRQWWNELIPAPIASAGATPAISTASGKDVELIADVVVQAVLKTPSGSNTVTKGKRGASGHAWYLADRQALRSCAANPWGGSAVSCPQLFSQLIPVFELYDSQDDAEVSRELLMSYLFQADTSALAPAKRRSVRLADHFRVQAGPGESERVVERASSAFPDQEGYCRFGGMVNSR
ncbi:hypothetical protein A1Q2_01234 [Trichosporon asahii var. asahii CBS 8904]|uniref:Uncharacterized protein n=1 Tax=Trichosporon asahii var. asahii (strain CBS 8904) TaxID=1220162 RepID=K1W6B3_TRIAC|nr:hypothetical protein A1Q2_01234 [Trichosporon asahii var. asahii CBS 8904]